MLYIENKILHHFDVGRTETINGFARLQHPVNNGERLVLGNLVKLAVLM